MSALSFFLQANVYLTLFYVFYIVFLRKETFFKLNRAYLLTAVTASFVIPVVRIEYFRQLWDFFQAKETSAAIRKIVLPEVNLSTDSSGLLADWAVAAYWTGVLIFSCVLAWKLIVLLAKWQIATGSAWSFFNRIVVSDQVEGKDTIYYHESVHARQFHSADILFLEMVLVLVWFNPVVYLYKRALRHTHEFIADNETTRNISVHDYTLLLVGQTFGMAPTDLANSFFSDSLLKQRIIMLQRIRSGKPALLKYGLALPLFVAMLALSSATIVRNSISVRETEKMMNSLPIPVLTGDMGPKEDRTIADVSPKPVLENEPALKKASMQQESSTLPEANLSEAPKPSVVAEPAITPDETPKDEPIFDFAGVTRAPEFRGGQEAMAAYIKRNYRYPVPAVENKISGKVIMQFIVEKDGQLADIKVVRDLGYGTADEAVRVLKTMPSWIPGMQDNKPVRVMFVLPIGISLADR